ncbi:phosphopantothenoylcysteine decarboxylase/phosphopantothenate--cysteine ligase [Candidatus Vecturithrix granuli]|uniref:Phosphopantothenoylcysteine decarboxylase/phosphopantothenate--cysteine ligase n=1 Tax=Vecturithrix granuli TaxID=1499967 RepID=A0A081BWG0_VECG1|nr:phosphopantothenoylcysteine decarboxylase/phosphopantothenate--cysteine ligase [Candidatus Vecturithrix granuli]
MLLGKTVVLGVSGGIAAWQTPEIIGQLQTIMVNVYCIMTKAAAEFITPLTLQVASQNPVAVDQFERRKEWNIAHIALADVADLLLIAPATANIIAKIAHGIADDLLSTTVLATTAPVVIAPAMNPKMYANPATQANLARVREFGYHIVEPEYGKTACGTEGVGRLARIPVIINAVTELLSVQRPIIMQ